MDEIDIIKKEINELTEKIFQADRAYYIISKPIMSDIDYDRLFERLKFLEIKYPHLKSDNSPTSRVGSDIDNALPEKEHNIPVLSLDKCYSLGELLDWYNKTEKKNQGKVDITIEPKIDGASVVLYYENGNLISALTRGNGYVGNDITNNIRTIKTVPLRVEYKGRFAVRGEVFIKKEDFRIFNEKYADGEYANPRNLASGSVRRVKSSETAILPLNLFVYDGYFYDDKNIKDNITSLKMLYNLNFPVNSHIGYFTVLKYQGEFPFKDGVTDELTGIKKYIEHIKNIRNTLDYEIDGLVVKVNDFNLRENLGYTQHHPRWAIAYKFDAPLAQTKVLSIVTQIGRGGRATPVANLEPVRLSGSTISRATLHNQDYIDSLEVNVGDIVTISKRGDVIPAVEEVVEKGDFSSGYELPTKCPSCNSLLVKDGAHLFCVSENCPKKMLSTLQYFVARDQMDIETLGDKTLEFLFDNYSVKTISDIYTFDYKKLSENEGFKDKKIGNIVDSIDNSKNKPFNIVLSSLGLKDIGGKVAELLTKRFKNIDTIIETAGKRDISLFTSIDGIGESIANSIIKHFTDERNLLLIKKLRDVGLQFEIECKDISNENLFLDKTKWVITGSFNNFKPRDKAGELIKKYGGDIIDTVSSKTNYLLCGFEPGSKLDKAKKLGIKIIDENEFINIIESKKI